MSAVRVGIAGGLGRMGRAVASVTEDQRAYHLAALLVSPNSLDRDPGSAGSLRVPVSDDIHEFVHQVDVVIDFTTADTMLALAPACAEQRVALVSGTTGMGPAHHAAMESAGTHVPVLWSPNMSLGINAMLKVLPVMARALGDYDTGIVETHHRQKRDAPSGTAVALATCIDGADGPRSVALHSVRIGGNPGTHSVVFGGGDDEVTITHRVYDRTCYARGALAAAWFVIRKPPGLYSMADVVSPVAV